MAMHFDHRGTMVPQETNFDNADQPGIAQPYTQSEIEELLYGDNRPIAERLARLYQLRDESAARDNADMGEHDAAALLDEVERAIDELRGATPDDEDYAGLATAFDYDPANRLDALAADDEEAREAIEGGDNDLAEDDERPWDGGAEYRNDFH